MSKQKEFERLARHYIKRKGIEDLLESLSKSDFYKAPASTRYHHSYEGGLVTHSLEVFDTLCKDLMDNSIDNFSWESVAIVGLFHDICKIGYYVSEIKNRKVYSPSGRKKDSMGKYDWESYMGYSVDDKLPLGHSEKSIIMLQQHMKLLPDEIFAINAHMGGFDTRTNIIGNCFAESELAVYLHIADLKSTYLGADK